MPPLVSILIPAYNAERWIAETIRSALAQTWPAVEIIVVDDGSTDRTVEAAQAFASNRVEVVTKENEGAATTRNRAYRMCQGRYIQWLDADDLLSPDKVERQMRELQRQDDNRVLASSAWAYFAFRPHRARFVPTSLWQDQSPVEWLLRKMGENLHMQTATWLTSRELSDSAGPWDKRMLSDDDGEYFCRVLLASRGVRFVRESRVYYRRVATSRLSNIGTSDRRMDAMLHSMRLHVQYIRSLERSERVDSACLRYLGNWQGVFDPARDDIKQALAAMAGDLGGHLEQPSLRRKYAWLEPIVGPGAAWRTQRVLGNLRVQFASQWDCLMSSFDHANAGIR